MNAQVIGAGSDGGLSSKNVVSIVIPALNEESGIAKTISEIPREGLEEMGYDCEVVVVDGGSRDHTREVARERGARVVVERRPGYGLAYKTGFVNTRGNIIVALDADFSYPAFLIPQLVGSLGDKKLDFISTNRLNGCNQGSFSPFHLVGNRILTYFTRLLLRVNIMDSQSGMWVFRREIVDQMSLSSNGMPFSEEIKVFAFKFFRSAEVQIPYRKRIGKQKLRTLLDGTRNLVHIFSLRLSFSSVAPLLNRSNVASLKTASQEVGPGQGIVLQHLSDTKKHGTVVLAEIMGKEFPPK